MHSSPARPESASPRRTRSWASLIVLVAAAALAFGLYSLTGLYVMPPKEAPPNGATIWYYRRGSGLRFLSSPDSRRRAREAAAAPSSSPSPRGGIGSSCDSPSREGCISGRPAVLNTSNSSRRCCAGTSALRRRRILFRAEVAFQGGTDGTEDQIGPRGGDAPHPAGGLFSRDTDRPEHPRAFHLAVDRDRRRRGVHDRLARELDARARGAGVHHRRHRRHPAVAEHERLVGHVVVRMGPAPDSSASGSSSARSWKAGR